MIIDGSPETRLTTQDAARVHMVRDQLHRRHPLPWSYLPDAPVGVRLLDRGGAPVSLLAVQEWLAAAVNGYVRLPELLGEALTDRARLHRRVAELDQAHTIASSAADRLREGVVRALGLAEHDGDDDLLERLGATDAAPAV